MTKARQRPERIIRYEKQYLGDRRFFWRAGLLFFIPLLLQIHPEFAAIYADLSGDFGDSILMNPGRLSRRTGMAILMEWIPLS